MRLQSEVFFSSLTPNLNNLSKASVILSPIKKQDRELSIDVLRGFAVLGMLLMSVQHFSMPSIAVNNPTIFENLSGVHLGVYLVSHVFADQKFEAIFSILMGASIIMISNRAKKEQIRSEEVQKKRLFWLLIIGLIHAYLIWYGDFLFAYAICGTLMFRFRRKKSKALFRYGLLFLTIGSAISLLIGYTIPHWETVELQEQILQLWLPSSESIGQEIDFYRSNWERQIAYRANQAFDYQTRIFLTETLWRVSGLMLIGMAFYKKRVLIAKQSKKYYLKMVIYGLGIGLPLVAAGTVLDFAFDWKFELSYFYFSQFNYWGSVLMAIGYIGLIMLFMKFVDTGFFTEVLGAVGQMSLSNYILQSIILSFIFYGHGLALFGDLDRAAQAFAVIMICAFQMTFSCLWLKYFRFGPLEWTWRSLTYGKKQPFIK